MNLNEQEAQPLELEYRTIRLTKGQFAVVDSRDYESISKWHWQAMITPTGIYAVRGVYREDGSHSAVLMHREIMDAPEGVFVDHRNRDTLDNKRLNLRLATKSQNQHNHGIQKNNTSGFKGVSWDKWSGKWSAMICVNSKRQRIGRFSTPELASEAYKKAADELHGEFASY